MSPMVSPARAQAAYYALSGAWPIVAYRSFEAVTGPKREPWLVKTLGSIVLVMAAAMAADPNARERGTRRLAAGSIAAFFVVDVWYAGIRRRIAPTYLGDAAVQALLAAWWLAWDRRR